MHSTIHSQVVVPENHRAKAKSGQAELGCIGRSVFPSELDRKEQRAKAHSAFKWPCNR